MQVLVGRVISGTSFDPKFAMLVQNKEQKTRRLGQVQKLCPRSAFLSVHAGVCAIACHVESVRIGNCQPKEIDMKVDPMSVLGRCHNIFLLL